MDEDIGLAAMHHFNTFCFLGLLFIHYKESGIFPNLSQIALSAASLTPKNKQPREKASGMKMLGSVGFFKKKK